MRFSNNWSPEAAGILAARRDRRRVCVEMKVLRLLLTLGATLLAGWCVCGCGVLLTPCPYTPDTYTELGIGVSVDPLAADWAHDPDLAERIDRVARIVAEYADLGPDILSGWVVRLSGERLVTCSGEGNYIGCAWYDSGWMEVSAAPVRYGCVEQTALAHEFLHALGLRGHLDPLWTDWVEVADRIAEYGPVDADGAPCAVGPEMWRHERSLL